MANTISLVNDYPVITHSLSYYERANGLIPAHTQTLAKGPKQYVGGSPLFIERGNGSHVWDVDGNEFIDYQMAIGPVSLGYCYPKVDDAIKEQLLKGITFSMMSPLEVHAAELIRSISPNAEMIRFSKTGCDVTSAAIRLARAFTKRRKILCCGYHGWHDWYIAVTDRSKGIPDTVGDLTYTFNYNDIESVAQSLDDDVACVILEPMVFEHPKNNYLQELKDLCSKNGTLLIFDEMWTGFRLASGGAQEYFGIKADLVCYSKAIANGMPISVLAGRSDVMSQLDEDVFFYTTFGGEALSLAAAIATMNEIREKNVPEYLSRQGKKLRDGYLTLVKKYELEELTNCIGADCRTMITFSNTFADPLIIKSFVQQEMIKRGILWGGVHNVSYSHSDGDIEYTLEVYDVVLAQLKTAYLENTIESKLRGRPVSAVFRKTENFNIKPVLK